MPPLALRHYSARAKPGKVEVMADEPRIIKTYQIKAQCYNCREHVELPWPRGKARPEAHTRFPEQVYPTCGCRGTIEAMDVLADTGDFLRRQ